MTFFNFLLFKSYMVKSGIQFHINACHPNIWKFLDVIKRKENLTQVKITQCLGGHPNIPQKKKYLDCNVRITNIVQNYAALPTLDYVWVRERFGQKLPEVKPRVISTKAFSNMLRASLLVGKIVCTRFRIFFHKRK